MRGLVRISRSGFLRWGALAAIIQGSSLALFAQGAETLQQQRASGDERRNANQNHQSDSDGNRDLQDHVVLLQAGAPAAVQEECMSETGRYLLKIVVLGSSVDAPRNLFFTFWGPVLPIITL